MPRITLDHHSDCGSAASVLTSLREVGLKPEDVGSLWSLGDAPPPLDDANAPPADFYEVTLLDLGAVQVSGWIADAALAALRNPGRLRLAALLEEADLDPEELDRVQNTVASGGGIIGVKARDALTGDETEWPDP